MRVLVCTCVYINVYAHTTIRCIGVCMCMIHILVYLYRYRYRYYNIYTRRFASREAYAARYARSGRKKVHQMMRSGQRSMIDYIRGSFFVIVVANWRLDNAKSPAAMLQEKTARKPHTIRVADAVRTYIPQGGYLFSSFGTWYALRLYSHVRKRKHRHSSTAKTMKMKPIFSE